MIMVSDILGAVQEEKPFDELAESQLLNKNCSSHYELLLNNIPFCGT